MTASKTRAVPELSIDTQTIERLLWEIKVGETIAYATLSAAIGRDVQHHARHILRSACDRVLREKQMVFAAVVNVGMKRLDDLGIVSTGASTIRRIYNLSRRGQRTLAAVAAFDALPNDQKVRHNLTMGQLGMLTYATSGTTIKKLELKAGAGTEPLPTAKFLDAMRDTL
jgi:hypothetical protein